MEDIKMKRNEKGQFVSNNSGRKAPTNIQFISEPFVATLSRNGQEHPSVGNKVVVTMIVTLITQPIPFDLRVLGMTLTNYGGYTEKELSRVNRVFEFASDKWIDAFDEAETFFKKEVDKYNQKVFERQIALLNAE